MDLARIGFGQSVALTPIQMMMAANSVINGGKLMKPYIVSEIQTPDGETLERFHPTVMAAPFSPETSDTMRLLLERVVSEGGGKNAAIAGLPHRAAKPARHRFTRMDASCATRTSGRSTASRR